MRTRSLSLVLFFFIFLSTTSCSSAPFDGTTEKSSMFEPSNIEQVPAPFPGFMYKPKNINEKMPVILLLHGSEGGNGDYFKRTQQVKGVGRDALAVKLARYYASRGFITMALCYFDCEPQTGVAENPPNELVRVDIEKHVIKPYLWLKNEMTDSNGRVALWGMSRGAELALITAGALQKREDSFSPDVVVALSPPNEVYPSFPLKAAQAITAGEKPDFSQASLNPAWVLGKHEYSAKEKINLSGYKNPYLVTYFTSDFVWGKYIQASKLYDDVKSQKTAAMLSVDKTTSLDFDYQFSMYPHRFIQLNKTGHVYAFKGTNEFNVQVRAINKIMDHFLK